MPLKNDPHQNALNRRQFLVRSAKAGLSIAATCAIGYRFYDASGPVGVKQESEEAGLPDFSVPGAGGRLGIVRGRDRVKTLQLALKAMGGLDTYEVIFTQGPYIAGVREATDTAQAIDLAVTLKKNLEKNVPEK